MKRRTNQGGFTLLEVIVAAAISTIVLFAVIAFGRSMARSNENLKISADQTFDTQRAFTSLRDELIASAPSVITIRTTDPDHDEISYKVAIGVTSGGLNIWGMRDASGTGHPGWSATIYVDKNRRILYKQLYDESGNKVGDPVPLVTGVDEYYNDPGGTFSSNKGFSVSLQGSLLTLTVRLRGSFLGHEWRREVSCKVRLRNS